MIGRQLNHYEITKHLGSGGMGDVYEAVDSRLGRRVAIKILPETFSSDPERVARFQREAHVLALLNHPNIAAIYGLEESGTQKFLVMELASGETLAASIARGPIPLDETVAVTRQIAAALETTHEQGVTHRDLKPANIMVSAEGYVKVLDFGLAKAADSAATNLSNSPTQLTGAISGVILGTAAYMSPEQAKGKPVDRTTDLWAFGCVLYEMLTGRPAFEGETPGEVVGAVFRAEPEWNRLPRETPESIRRLLRRCLQKDPRLRLHDMHDARIEIEESQSGPATSASPGPKPSRGIQRVAWTTVVVLTLIAAIEAIGLRRPGVIVMPAPEVRLEISTPPTTDPLSLALSPDGQKIVFVATSAGRPQLWLRRLDSVAALPLPGTEYSSMPFWSPDSESVGYFLSKRAQRRSP